MDTIKLENDIRGDLLNDQIDKYEKQSITNDYIEDINVKSIDPMINTKKSVEFKI